MSQGQLTHKWASPPMVDLEEKDKKKLGQSESVAGECGWGHGNKTFPDGRRLKIMTKREAGEALMESGAKE